MTKILVVDDNAMMRGMIRDMLDIGGYAVIVADQGKAALSLIRKDSPDLVITDILMPEMDGMETILEIRERYPKMRIIVISGGGAGLRDKDLLETAESFNLMGTLEKPFTTEKLLDVVGKALASDAFDPDL